MPGNVLEMQNLSLHLTTTKLLSLFEQDIQVMYMQSLKSTALTFTKRTQYSFII